MENKLEEYSILLKNNSYRLTAERLVMLCNVRIDLKGYRRLVDAVILYGTDSLYESCKIYRAIGLIRGIKEKTVMREISYAVNHAYDLHERLSELVGVQLTKNDIHNSLVIAYLGTLFKNACNVA